MRESVMGLQSSEIEFIECSICFEAISEKDVALTVRYLLPMCPSIPCEQVHITSHFSLTLS